MVKKKRIIRRGKGRRQKHSEFLIKEDTGAVEHGTTTQLDSREVAARVAMAQLSSGGQIPQDDVITGENVPLDDVGKAQIYETNSQGGFTTMGGTPVKNIFDKEGAKEANRYQSVSDQIAAAAKGGSSEDDLSAALMAATSRDDTAPDDHEFAAKAHQAFQDLEGVQRVDAALDSIDSGADDTEAMGQNVAAAVEEIAKIHEQARVDPRALVDESRRRKNTDELVREALHTNPAEELPFETDDVLGTGELSAMGFEELDASVDADGFNLAKFEFIPLEDDSVSDKGEDGNVKTGTLEGYAVNDPALLAEIAKPQEQEFRGLPVLEGLTDKIAQAVELEEEDKVEPLDESIDVDLEDGELDVTTSESGEFEEFDSVNETPEPATDSSEEELAKEISVEFDAGEAGNLDKELDDFVLESPPKAQAVADGEESFAKEREGTSEVEDERNIPTEIVRAQKGLATRVGETVNDTYTAVRYGTPGWVKFTLGIGIAAAGTIYAVTQGIEVIEENRPYVGEEEQVATTGKKDSKDYKAVAKADSGSKKAGAVLDGGAMDKGVRKAVLEDDSDAGKLDAAKEVDSQIDALVDAIVDAEDDPDVLDAKDAAKRTPKRVSDEELARNMDKASVKSAGGDIRDEYGTGRRDYGIDEGVTRNAGLDELIKKVEGKVPIAVIAAKAPDFETYKGSELFDNPADPNCVYGIDSDGVAHKYNPDGSEVKLSAKGKREVKKYIAAKTPIEESETLSGAMANTKKGASGLAKILGGVELPEVSPDEDKTLSGVYQDAKAYVFLKGESAWSKSVEIFGSAKYFKTIEMLVGEQRGTPKRTIILEGEKIETRTIDGKNYIVKKLKKGDTVWKSAKVIARDTNTPIVTVYEDLLKDNGHIDDLSKVDVGEEVFIRTDYFSK